MLLAINKSAQTRAALSLTDQKRLSRQTSHASLKFGEISLCDPVHTVSPGLQHSGAGRATS